MFHAHTKMFHAHISLENTDNHKRDMIASERAANNHLLRHLFPLLLMSSIISDQSGTSEVFSPNRVCLLRDPLPPRPPKTFSTNSCKRNIIMGEQADPYSGAYPLRHPIPLPPDKISTSPVISLTRSIQDQKRDVLRNNNIDGHLLRRPLNFPPAATTLLHPLRRIHLSLSLHFRSWTTISKT